MARETGFKIKNDGGVFYLSGSLDSDANLDALNKASEPLRLNLNGLDRMNSLGIMQLLKFIAKWGDRKFEYIECPIDLIHNINVVPSLLGPSSNRTGSIISMYIPFVCPECGHECNELCQAGDFAVSGDSVTGPKKECAKCHGVLQPEESFTTLLGFMFNT